MCSLHNIVILLLILKIQFKNVSLNNGNSSAHDTTCKLPFQPENGKYTINRNQDLPPGTMVPDSTYLVYKCEKDYAFYPTTRTSTATIPCANGKWAENFPTCRKTCPPVTSESLNFFCELDKHEVNCSLPMVEKTMINMKCKRFYVSVDHIWRHSYAICVDGTWDRDFKRCEPECGCPVAIAQPLIVHGRTAAPRNFPWHVAFYEVLAENKEYICGGSIINMNIVIAAAHCFADMTGKKQPANNYLVSAGKLHIEYDNPHDLYVQHRKIKQIIIPDDYRGEHSSYSHDIALIIVDKSFTPTDYVKKICIDWSTHLEETFLEKKIGMIVGWGKTEKDLNKPSETLRYLTVPFVDKMTCVESVPEEFKRIVTPDKICAGWRNEFSWVFQSKL